MADSEISTSLRLVTRRGFLTGTVLATSVHPFQGHAQGVVTYTDRLTSDGAYSRWQEWRAAHQMTEKLCHEQQRLETRLMKMVGVHPTEPNDQNTEARARLDSDVSRPNSCLTRWDAADAEIGYSAAKAAEERAAEHEQELAQTLWTTPAQSVAGIAAKLDALLREGEWCEACPEFPWPQVRSALTDLIRLARVEDLISP